MHSLHTSFSRHIMQRIDRLCTSNLWLCVDSRIACDSSPASHPMKGIHVMTDERGRLYLAVRAACGSLTKPHNCFIHHISAPATRSMPVDSQVNAFLKRRQEQQQRLRAQQERQLAADRAGYSYRVRGVVESRSSLGSSGGGTDEETIVFRPNPSSKPPVAPMHLLYEVQYLTQGTARTQAQTLLAQSPPNSRSGSPARTPANASPMPAGVVSSRRAEATIKLWLQGDGSGWATKVIGVSLMQPRA